MRNSPTASPLVETSFESFYNSLSDREKDSFDRDEREQFIRQIGMNEIDNQIDWPIDWPEEMMEVPDQVSDEEVMDLTGEDRDYAAEYIRTSFTDRMAAMDRQRARPPRHILRKAR